MRGNVFSVKPNDSDKKLLHNNSPDNSEFLKLPAHNRFNVCAFEALCSESGNKNNIPRSIALARERCVSRADNSAAAVALDGAARLFAHGNAVTAHTCAVFHSVCDERRIGFASAPVVGVAEFDILI